jgi:hypothetical protein
MKPSTALRRAALGPIPERPAFLYSWVPYIDKAAAVVMFTEWPDFRLDTDGLLCEMTNDERRMFLLFVAEALEWQK